MNMNYKERFFNRSDHKMFKRTNCETSSCSIHHKLLRSKCYSNLITSIVFIVIFCFKTTQIETRNYFDSHRHPSQYNGRCEEIQISFCRDLPYNQTILPNLFDHQSQDVARNHLRVYEPLIKLKCSPYLQLFLCTLYAPICLNAKEPIPPCRNLCLSAKNGCEKHIPSDWDTKFNCSNFPLFDNQPLCIWKPDDYASINLINKDRSSSLDKTSNRELVHHYNASWGKQFRFSCPVQFRTASKKGHVFNLNGKKYTDCATPCDLYLNKDQMKIVRYWTGFWSFIALVASLFTFLTFFIDSKRFQYPEKQIVFLSLCYIFISLIYLFGFLANNQIACTPHVSTLADDYNLEMIESVTQGSASNAYCTLIAMALYYFQMASAIWFVLLTISWYLHIGRKWSHEGIEKNAHYYHLIAWTVPAIKTIVLVSRNQLEGDQLTGICYVGLLDRDNLMNYLFWFLAIYLMMGTGFFVITIYELCKIRRTLLVLKDIERERIVMFKIILFGTLYIIPNLILVTCHLIEYYRIDNWSLSWLSRTCSNKQFGIPCPNLTSDEEEIYKPNLSFFLIKYLALLATGCTCGVWIFTMKTIQSWRTFNEQMMKKIFCPDEKSDQSYL